MKRDFTYIDDIVNGIILVNDSPPKEDLNWQTTTVSQSSAPYKVYNIGNNNPVKLTDFIEAIENKLGVKAEQNLLPMQPGDVTSTYADVNELMFNLGYKSTKTVEFGVSEFIDWYKIYYQID